MVPWNSKIAGSKIKLDGDRQIELPPLSGAHNETEVPLPFVIMDEHGTRFLLPLVAKDNKGIIRTELQDVDQITFDGGDQRFYFVFLEVAEVSPTPAADGIAMVPVMPSPARLQPWPLQRPGHTACPEPRRIGMQVAANRSRCLA